MTREEFPRIGDIVFVRDASKWCGYNYGKVFKKQKCIQNRGKKSLSTKERYEYLIENPEEENGV